MSAALLAVRGLSKRFGGLQAIRDLSFDVAPGEVLGLIGPNGAGKTTAFNLISGFLVPDEGDVVFDGRSLVGLKPHAICQRRVWPARFRSCGRSRACPCSTT